MPAALSKTNDEAPGAGSGTLGTRDRPLGASAGALVTSDQPLGTHDEALGTRDGTSGTGDLASETSAGTTRKRFFMTDDSLFRKRFPEELPMLFYFPENPEQNDQKIRKTQKSDFSTLIL
uniref:Uncharacterized protein n=1 Tax=Candidatus Kentrum sp. FW TaxID=2126338 RepID=A0A450TY28_9GAMM|nr:MAG: hypothetical protein BECKFW1821C_GA0114237_10632 [Candidatus Kentron sp. FW]